MLPTAVLKNCTSPGARISPPGGLAALEPGAPGDSERILTQPVPVRAATAEIPEPHPLTVTPAPIGDLRFSCSAWSTDGDLHSGEGGGRAPRVGDTLFGFRLVGELGRGAFARVFLAEQEALANRRVALKVTLRPTREAERLARLQHTNVVPVYSVHTEGTVQVICMPYLGRVTVADLIRAYRADSSSRTAGRKSTRAARTTEVNSKSKLHPKSDGKTGPHRVPTWTWAAEGPPPIVGDPVAVLQVLAQLADGLGHAHERGILHLDLKPGNVLLADTGEPMLLDFNLSFDSANPARDLVGGTMPYMAIEQLRDMRERGKGNVDARTDLYALGVVAFELLTGRTLFPTSTRGMRDVEGMIELRRKGPPAMRELNPAVTPAVEAIVRKLLAAEPGERYRSAAELREDIDSHLADKPLKYAREASLRERFGKWRRRNPRLPLKLLAACLIGLTIGLGGVAQKRADANARYEAVRQAEATHAALHSLRLDLIRPDDPEVRERGFKRAAERLTAYGLPIDADWQKRPEVRKLTDAERELLAGDLGELAILLAEAKWRLAAGRPEVERRELAAEAWKLNAAARTCFAAGAAPLALGRQAALIAPAAGESFTPPADARKGPLGARDEFLEAACAVVAGRYAGAEKLLERVVEAQPGHAAAQFLLAHCRQQKGDYGRAHERYEAARVLLPKDPRSAFERGQMYLTGRRPDKAEAEFTKAIALDDRHAESYRNRALARYRLAMFARAGEAGKKQKQRLLAGAEADLGAALERGSPPLLVHWMRAWVRDDRGDRAGADRDRAAVKGVALKTEIDFLVRGWTLVETDARAALADFRRAAEINPCSLTALQNQAHVLAEKLRDNEGSLVVLNKLVELHPEFAPALAGRAVVLARLGKRDEAHKEIARARLLSEDPEILYQAASVYSLTSKAESDDKARAIELLRKAFNEGYRDLKGIATDRDLDPIRDQEDFLLIRQSADALYR